MAFHFESLRLQNLSSKAIFYLYFNPGLILSASVVSKITDNKNDDNNHKYKLLIVLMLAYGVGQRYALFLSLQSILSF